MDVGFSMGWIGQVLRFVFLMYRHMYRAGKVYRDQDISLRGQEALRFEGQCLVDPG